MSLTSLPDQTIPETKKTKEWHMEHALGYARYSITDNYNEQRKDILKYYRGYNAELNNKERKLADAIERPHGTYLGIEYVVYPLIQSKIEQIVGEFIQRPLRRKSYVLDKKSKNKKFDEKLNMLAEEMMREVTKGLKENLGFDAQTKNPNMNIPADIEEHDFKTVAEEVADGLINIFLDVRKEKSKFKQLFTDYCISDRAHVVIEKKQGFTSARKVHPLDCDYDIDPYKVVQDDHEYFFENYYLTENEIYNTFPQLTNAEKKEVAEMFMSISDSNSVTNESQDLGSSQKYDGFIQTSNKVHRMRLISAMWKSRKRVSVKVSDNSYGGQFYKKLDPEHKEKENVKIENIDGDMPRFVMMLGPEMCLDYGIMEKRYSSIDDPFRCHLPVVSIVRDNTIGSSLIKSVAAKLYQLQEIASEVLFEIRVALKSAGDSRVLVYDAAQTPKEFSQGGYEAGLNRVMHHIKKDKMMIINSKQKGAQATGGGFNQFTSLDLSQKGAVQDLFNGLAIIEDLAAKFVGMAPEREGQVGDYQTATGTDRAIRGSTARTEIIFTPFDEFLQSLLEKVILSGKHHYENGEVIHYIFGEMKTKFLTLFDDFFAADFGLYLSDARKDKEASERINAAAEMALSNSNSPEMVMGLIEVFEGDSANEKKQVFKKMLDAMEKTRQASEKAMQESTAAQIEADTQDKDKNRGISREGFQKDKDVALIYKEGKGADGVRKNISQERMKAADIEQKDRASQSKLD
jgi:hypothetical protein